MRVGREYRDRHRAHIFSLADDFWRIVGDHLVDGIYESFAEENLGLREILTLSTAIASKVSNRMPRILFVTKSFRFNLKY